MIRELPHLTRRSMASPWRMLAMRAGMALSLLAVAFCFLWFDRDGLKDNLDGVVTFADTLYFTMITVTTVGYGDIVPVTEKARLIDAFLLTPIRLFIWLIFLGTAFELLFKRVYERWRMKRIQEDLCNHVVIAGFGKNGSSTAERLLAGGLKPAELVVIDCCEKACEMARALGAAVIQGDASRDELLEAVRIGQARRLIVSAGRDDTGILIALSARKLAPGLPIAIAIRNQDNEDIAEAAGASQVVNPVTVTARLLAEG
ncbi:potassium channel family protein [Sphingomonas humi]|uniref:RCK N-terminal domain-containing protein n=1 Tax=Sphingomonas humi TaxID=335630 RepID=A0ABP7RZR2_9SPHN